MISPQVSIAVAGKYARFLEEIARYEWRANHRVPASVHGRILRDHVRPRRIRRELQVRRIASGDQVRPAGARLDDRGYCPVAEELAYESLALNRATTRVHTAEHEAVTLVKRGIRALLLGVIAVLWRQRRFQVCRIIDRMRPRVRRQELIMRAEALAQVRRQAVIDRAPVGKVG